MTASDGESGWVKNFDFLTILNSSFGGAASPDVQVVDATQLKVRTPAHAGGTVDVEVAAPDGQVATLTNGFSFVSSSSDCGCRVGGVGESGHGWALLLVLAIVVLVRRRYSSSSTSSVFQ